MHLQSQEARILNETPSIEAAGATQAGLFRSHNEDSFAVREDLGLFLVADGVGGAAGGEVASRMAVDTVQSYFQCDNPESPLTLGFEYWEDREQARFILSLWRANRCIYDAARHNMTTRGMATTFAGVALTREGICVAHVGDSRVYRLRNGSLDALTEDHSLRNEYLRRRGVMRTARASLEGVNLDTLTRALGLARTVKVDSRVEPAAPGDVVLIGSDGLTGPVPEDEIAAILSEPGDLDATVRRLITRAQNRGGRDDITCIVVRWTDAWRKLPPLDEARGRTDETP